MFIKYLNVYFILSIIFICQNDASKYSLNIFPTIRGEIYLRTGSNLTIECHISYALTGVPDNITAKSLYFHMGTKYLPTRLINSTAVQLIIPIVDKNLSHSNLFCHLDDLTNKSLATTAAVIIVGDPPTKVNITECVVYNWQSMKCRWEPKSQLQETGVPTNTTLYWTITHSGSFSRCPSEALGECEWRTDINSHSSDHLRLGMEYHLIVIAKNIFGEESTDLTISVDDIVKPGLVNNIKVNCSKRSAQISWDHPFVGKSILANKKVIYYVNYTSRWHNWTLEKYLESNQIEIFNLFPYTYYTFYIYSQPYNIWNRTEKILTGFISEPTIFQKETQSDVPQKLPNFVPGSFYLQPNYNGFRFVELYWTPPPEIYFQGRIKSTRIRYQINTALDYFELDKIVNETTINWPSCNTRLHLLSNKDYLISLDWSNSVGYNLSLAPANIWIPSNTRKDIMNVEIFFVVSNGSHISAHWPPILNTSFYTIFSCLVDASSHICKADKGIFFYPVNSTSSEESSLLNKTLKIDLSYNTKFGISTEYEINGVIFSSGIKWTDCVHLSSKMLKSPEKYHTTSHPSDKIILRWKDPICESTKFITNYLLVWCKKKSDCDNLSINDINCCYDSQNKTLSKYETSFIMPINTLEALTNYNFFIASMHFQEISNFSYLDSFKLPEDETFYMHIVLLCIFLAIFFCIVTIVIWYCYREHTRIIDIRPPTNNFEMQESSNNYDYADLDNNSYINPQIEETKYLMNDINLSNEPSIFQNRSLPEIPIENSDNHLNDNVNNTNLI